MNHHGTSIKTQISLLRGQSHYMQLRRGDVVEVSSGTVLIITRVYLEYEAITRQTVVRPGVVYQVPVTGACEIAAQRPATMVLLSARRAGCLGQLQRVVGRWLFSRPFGMLHALRPD